MNARFRVTARDETGRLRVTTVKSRTSPSFHPNALRAALAEATAKGTAAMVRRGVKRPIPETIDCLD